MGWKQRQRGFCWEHACLLKSPSWMLAHCVGGTLPHCLSLWCHLHHHLSCVTSRCLGRFDLESFYLYKFDSPHVQRAFGLSFLCPTLRVCHWTLLKVWAKHFLHFHSPNPNHPSLSWHTLLLSLPQQLASPPSPKPVRHSNLPLAISQRFFHLTVVLKAAAVSPHPSPCHIQILSVISFEGGGVLWRSEVSLECHSSGTFHLVFGDRVSFCCDLELAI